MKNYIFTLLLFAGMTSYAQTDKTIVSGGFSILNSYRYLQNTNGSSTTQSTIDMRDGMEQQLISSGGWVNLDYYFKKRVFVYGGLRFARLGYKYSLPLSGFSDTSDPVTKNLTEVIHKDIYYVLSMPLGIGYCFLSKSHARMYIAAGAGPDLMVKNYIQQKRYFSNGDSKKQTFPDAALNSKRVNLSYSVSFGLLSQLSAKDGLKFNLLYYSNIGNFNSDPVGLHLNALSLDIGYVRQF